MRIDRLTAQNIGAFEQLDLVFKPKQHPDKADIHILTGANGTGKSTVLLMLASCADKDNDELLMKRFRYRDSVEGSAEKIRSRFTITFLPAIYFVSFSQRFNTSTNQTFYYSNLDQDNLRFNLLPKKENHFDPCFGYSGYRDIEADNKVSINEVSIDPFNKAIDFKKQIDFNTILNWIATNKAKAAFAELRGDTAKAQTFGSTVKKIEQALSGIIKQEITFAIEDQPFQVFLQLNNQLLDFNILPDGLKSIISWLSDLLMRLDRINWEDKTKSILDQSFILFLDEIEVHLHPTWQRKILPVIQTLFPNAQIIISTHSPFVVGSVDGAWVYKFKIDEHGNSVLANEPILTEDGNSYQYYLREVFDITSEFGEGVTEELAIFMQQKEAILQNKNIDRNSFEALAQRLADQSIELNSIIGYEMRKLNKKLLVTT